MKFRKSEGIKENYVDGGIREHTSKDPADLILDAIGFIPQHVHLPGKQKTKH